MLVQDQVALVQGKVALVQREVATRVPAKQHFPDAATSTQEGPMADWDSGQHWDEGLFWDSASPPPLPTASNHKRKSTMKRQPFFPRIIAARPYWFELKGSRKNS